MQDRFLNSTGRQVKPGSFIIGYYFHPERQEYMVAVQVRGETDEEGNHKLGATAGGFAEPKDMTPVDVALRETDEELKDGYGQPLLLYGPRLLEPLIKGVDSSRKFDCEYTGYSRKLDPNEWLRLERHAKRMRDDNEYKEKVIEITQKEFHGLECMSLAEAAKLPEARFTHLHELRAIQELAEKLAKSPPPIPGYSYL